MHSITSSTWLRMRRIVLAERRAPVQAGAGQHEVGDVLRRAAGAVLDHRVAREVGIGAALEHRLHRIRLGVEGEQGQVQPLGVARHPLLIGRALVHADRLAAQVLLRADRRRAAADAELQLGPEIALGEQQVRRALRRHRGRRAEEVVAARRSSPGSGRRSWRSRWRCSRPIRFATSRKRSTWKPCTPPCRLGKACGAKVPSTAQRSGGGAPCARRALASQERRAAGEQENGSGREAASKRAWSPTPIGANDQRSRPGAPPPGRRPGTAPLRFCPDRSHQAGACAMKSPQPRREPASSPRLHRFTEPRWSGSGT